MNSPVYRFGRTWFYAITVPALLCADEKLSDAYARLRGLSCNLRTAARSVVGSTVRR